MPKLMTETVASKSFVMAGLICLTLGTLAIGVFRAASWAGAELFDPPAVYLTWQRDPTTTMTIQWHSVTERDDLVQYQRLDEAMWHTAVGSHHPMPYSDRTVHVVELTDLSPGTDYRFRFGEDSVEFRFRTLSLSEPIRFIEGRDAMQRLDRYQAICRQAATQDPMFVVIGGDLAYDNGDPNNAARWYEWFDV